MSEMVYDIAVIGAGPGGLAAAKTAAARSARVVVIDEQHRAGGQIYRQAPLALSHGADKFGAHYVRGCKESKSIAAIDGIDWRFGEGVWSLSAPDPLSQDGFLVSTTGPEGLARIEAKRVIVAAGCYDMPVPFPGWTLPGVMGAGAIQALMKGQRVVAAERIVLAGSHPLLLIVAAQLLAFGVKPLRVVFSQQMSRAAGMLRRPDIAVGALGSLASATQALLQLKRAGVPVSFGQAVVRARGGEAVEAVEIAPIDRVTGLPDRTRIETVPCDGVGISYGFTASSELPRLAGAEAEWSRIGGGWIIRHDERMETSVRGLYVAGEVAGIGGAETAESEGRLAALCAIADAGAHLDSRDLAEAKRARRRCRRFASLLQQMADPRQALLTNLATEDATLCRCEEISVGEVRRVLAENVFIGTADAAKLLNRVGMGPCQGRYCHQSLLAQIAELRGSDPSRIGPFRARIPVKPVPLAHFQEK